MDHWRYFLALDDDFRTLSRYVEPATANLGTYSLEIARLLMAATQECDVVLKQVCNNYSTANALNEQSYRDILRAAIPPITQIKVLLPRFKLGSQPYAAWQSNKTPDWWTANNKVKHERHQQFSKASLAHVIDAISGLYVANLYLYPKEAEAGKLAPSPVYFALDLPSAGVVHIGIIKYRIPT